MLKTLSQAKSAYLRHPDGRRVIVWSYQHRDCASLGYHTGSMGQHLRRSGYRNGSGGWRGRFLTDAESLHLIHHSPCYYEVMIDGVVERCWNLSKLARQRGFAEPKGSPPPNVTRVIREGAGSCTSYGRRISGKVVFTGAPMVFDVSSELARRLEASARTAKPATD